MTGYDPGRRVRRARRGIHLSSPEPTSLSDDGAFERDLVGVTMEPQHQPEPIVYWPFEPAHGTTHVLALVQGLLAQQDAERVRLASAIQDDLGQLIAAASLSLQQVLSKLDAASTAEPGLRDTIQIIGQVLQRLRGMTLDLHPSLLDDLGLVAALRWYLRQHVQSNRLQIRLVVDPAIGRMPTSLERGCYRLIQEALTNVVRHAQATRCWVMLQLQDGALHVIVSDDGVGFDVQAAYAGATQRGSLGLLAMCARAQALGGQVLVESWPGHGAEVRACLPLPPSPVLVDPGAQQCR